MTHALAALSSLPPALSADVSVWWADYLQAAQQRNIAAPELNPMIARVWAGSEFVARSCIREPQLLLDLLGEFGHAQAVHELDTRCRLQLSNIEQEAQLSTQLRYIRRREMVRIAWRDLSGQAEVRETLADLSQLADTLTDSALGHLYHWLTQRFGYPCDQHGQRQQLVVLGMGKLGGKELNYSSDIDLIFVYPERGETDGSRGLDNEEFFRRLGQSLIRVLDANTADGMVFRVDLRLRPFGDAGPLAMPFSAFEEYYQNHGREWERYAMIKARVIAGDHDAGAQLLETLRPFVYRRYLDYTAIESLRDMKALIAKEVERKGMRRNVKLGPGGIREIEFIAQAFQLIYGGREPGLRTRSLYAVLEHLADSGRLPGHAVQSLLDAYEFLRRTENRIQAYADQQTHNLPEDDKAKLRLAFVMGYPDWGSFISALLRHTQLVSAQFAQVFAVSQEEGSATVDSSGVDFKSVWAADSEPEALQAFLQQQGFAHPLSVLEAITKFRTTFAQRKLGKQGLRRIDQLMPLLLAAVVSGSSTPDLTLERLLRLLEAIAQRSVYLALLVENSLALSQLVKLCSASGWIAQHLGCYPLLLDELLNPASLYAPLERTALELELHSELQKIAPNDEEGRLDCLRHFKQTQMLRVAAADVSGSMPLMVVSDHLTEIAETILRQTVELAWADVLPRFGQPCYQLNGQTHYADFAVIAYGKLGGIELGYGSDLDVVFLHDSCGEEQYTDGVKTLDNATFFAKLAQRVIHYLTAHTAAGVLYEVDTRLRPSGRSGLLVSSCDAFAEYQHKQAWTWEHQALVRARPIAGSYSIAQRFIALRQQTLARVREPEVLRREVREMRERMRRELSRARAGYFDLKQDPGGIADIEFIVQYLVLAHTQQEPLLARFTDNVRQIAGLEATGIISSWDAGLLRDTYRALRRRAHLLKLQEQPDVVSQDEWREHRAEVVRIWNALMVE